MPTPIPVPLRRLAPLLAAWLLLAAIPAALLTACDRGDGAAAPEIKPHPIVTGRRLALTREYNRHHYGLDSHTLKNPAIIVIHHTAIGTLRGSLKAFEGDRLPGHRRYIKRYGAVNVGVHFLVARNGDIYSLLPLDVTGRHAIGFNHLSIGIENVAARADRLTRAQVKANGTLVAYLAGKFGSIRYLVGHHEYTVKSLPHYRLYKELDPGYKPTVKSDPGPRFMGQLRALLKQEHQLVLER